MGNETGSLPCLWVEPWGTDHWMLPGEVFTLFTDTEPQEVPFNMVVHEQGVSVWVNAGFAAEVFDAAGNQVPADVNGPTSRCPRWAA